MSKLDILNQFTSDDLLQYLKRNGKTVLVFDGSYDWTTTINEGTKVVCYGDPRDFHVMKEKPRTITIEMTEIIK